MSSGLGSSLWRTGAETSVRTVIPHVNDSQSGAATSLRAGRRLFGQDQLGQGRGGEPLEGSDSGHFLAALFGMFVLGGEHFEGLESSEDGI